MAKWYRWAPVSPMPPGMMTAVRSWSVSLAAAAAENGKTFSLRRTGWFFVESGEVGRVIEEAGAFDRDGGRVVLAQAFEAGPAGGCQVGAPFGAGHPVAALAADEDAAIDDRDQVGVGGHVQHGAGPGPVDAAEQHVAIERGGEAGRFGDG